MKKQKNIPFLRFPEFTGEWEYKKLGQEISFLAGYAFDSNEMTNEPSKYQLIKMSNVYQNELRLDRNPTFWTNLQDKQKDFLLQNGDIVLTLTGTVGKRDYGYSIMIIESDKYLLNQRLVRLSEKKNRTTNSFIRYLVSYERFLYHFFSNSKGGTGNQSNVSIEDLKNMQLSIPSLPEQTRIATFLTAVDDKLIQLKQKKNLLEQYKKGVMQEIFSQEIRFKDDKGNDFPVWKMKRLMEIGEIKKGEQLNVTELSASGLYPALNGGVNASGYTNKWNTEANTISISEGGNSCGYVNFNNERFWSGGHCYTILNIDSTLHRYYLFQVLKFNELSIMRLRVGSGLPNIQKKDLIDFSLQIPILTEQIKIADFLSSIDEKISMCSSQIEKTEQYKKGLLQKMFC